MQKASSPAGKWQIAVFFLTALLVLAADQLSKIWIRSNLAVGQSLPETCWVRLTHVQNTGSAFGLFQGQSFPLMIVAMFGILVLLFLALFAYHWLPFLYNTWGKVALGLILGSTIGNLVDRLSFGYVTDFIDFGFWPSFNVADSAVVVGTLLFAYLLLSSFRTSKQIVG